MRYHRIEFAKTSAYGDRQSPPSLLVGRPAIDLGYPVPSHIIAHVGRRRWCRRRHRYEQLRADAAAGEEEFRKSWALFAAGVRKGGGRVKRRRPQVRFPLSTGRSPGAFINAIREVLHAEMMRVEVGGLNNPAVGEARMKSELDTNAADEDETKWLFLRRLIVAMAAERLKKADEVVKPRPPARRDDSH